MGCCGDSSGLYSLWRMVISEYIGKVNMVLSLTVNKRGKSSNKLEDMLKCE